MKPKKNVWFLYRMRCLVPGVGDYYGITTQPFRRESEHKRKKKGYKLAAAIALYGPEQFVYEVICCCGPEREARTMERDYIREFNTGWPNGLNVSCAGAGVYSRIGYEENYTNRRAGQIARWESEAKRQWHSERLLRAMSEPSAKQRNSDAAKRRWANPEYRARQLAAAGRKHSEETKEKLRQIKLAASAARGGPKKKARKYPGLSASEIGRRNMIRPDVQAKIKATRERNGSNRSPKIAALIDRLATDPQIKAKREESRRLYHANNQCKLLGRKRGPMPLEQCQKISDSKRLLSAQRKLLASAQAAGNA